MENMQQKNANSERREPPMDNGVDIFINYNGDALTISVPEGEASFAVDRQVRNLRLLNVGLMILKWMKQDIGGDSPEFEEKFRARCHEMSRILRTIFPEIGEWH